MTSSADSSIEPGCSMPGIDVEAKLASISAECRGLRGGVGNTFLMSTDSVVEMPQQRSDVDPDATRLQTIPDCLDVFDHVRCCVDEEDRDHGLEGVLLLRGGVDRYEIAGDHVHFSNALARVRGRRDGGGGVDVGDHDAGELGVTGGEVREGCAKGVQRMLNRSGRGCWDVVENPV